MKKGVGRPKENFCQTPGERGVLCRRDPIGNFQEDFYISEQNP